MSGIVVAQSGVPFSIFDGGFDANHNGTFNDRGAYIGPGGLGNAYTGNGPANPAGFINPNFFADVTCPANVNGGLWCQGPAVGQLNRNSLIGPRYVNTDLSIAKRFKITESAAFTLQGSFFNLFNHPNFAIPDNNLADFGTTFGQSLSTPAAGANGGARVTQLALRFDF